MDVDPPTWNNDEANNPVRKLTPLKKLKIKVEQDGKSECLDLKIVSFYIVKNQEIAIIYFAVLLS